MPENRASDAVSVEIGKVIRKKVGGTEALVAGKEPTVRVDHRIQQ